jgi:hypothetical protein
VGKLALQQIRLNHFSPSRKKAASQHCRKEKATSQHCRKEKATSQHCRKKRQHHNIAAKALIIHKIRPR